MKKTKFVVFVISLFTLTLNLQITAQDNTACGTKVTYQGKTYETVQIGEQCWFKENLNVGTMISVKSNQTKNDIIEKYCYNDDPANCELYGGLYRWNEAMQYVKTDGAQGICPKGWHIPTKGDWEILEEYVNYKAEKLIDKNAKSGSTFSNESGFSALLSGYSNSTWVWYYGLGYYDYQCTSTETSNRNAYGIFMSYNYDNISYYYNNKNNGFSVRCIKD